MFEIVCKDKYDKVITFLTQWDANQSLYIYNCKFDLLPVFHFCNHKSDTAMVVQSKNIDNGISVSIPNILLQEPYPIIAYAYLYDEDGSSKTICTIKIPIRQRVKPEDYDFVENIDTITLTELDVRLTKVYEKCLGSVGFDAETDSLRFYNENGDDVFEPVKISIDYDSELSSESKNAVQNKIVAAALNEKADKKEIPVVHEWALSSEKPSYTASEVGADSLGTSKTLISAHDVNTESHNDIRIFLTELNNRVNAIADCDDVTLDQLSEVVTYIKKNRELIDSVTTAKVNISDIIDNLSTNVGDKPLSAAQGVALKALIDAIIIPTTAAEVGAAPIEHTHDNYLTEADISMSGAISEIVNKNLETYRVLITDGNGKIVASSSVNNTELNALDGIQANIQEQLDGKLPSDGVAATALKLNTARNIGINLGSAENASFDGSKDISIGVTGILPILNGGLGTNNKIEAKQNLGIFFLDSDTPPDNWENGDIWLRPLE